MDFQTLGPNTQAGLALPPVTAASGAATTLSTTNAINYAIKGLHYTKAALAGAATPTTDLLTSAAFPSLAASQGTVVVLALDSAGNIKAMQGQIMALDSNNKFITAPQMPEVPDTVCPWCVLVLKNGSTGSAWKFGTNNWNATGLTVTVNDINTYPNRMLV